MDGGQVHPALHWRPCPRRLPVRCIMLGAHMLSYVSLVLERVRLQCRRGWSSSHIDAHVCVCVVPNGYHELTRIMLSLLAHQRAHTLKYTHTHRMQVLHEGDGSVCQPHLKGITGQAPCRLRGATQCRAYEYDTSCTVIKHGIYCASSPPGGELSMRARPAGGAVCDARREGRGEDLGRHHGPVVPRHQD